MTPPSVERCAVYDDTAAPPFETGADHATVTVPEPMVVATAVGADGVVRGVAAAEADGFPAPAALIAETRNA